MGHNWLPGKRVDQLAMARVWKEILTASGTAWGVPPADVTDLASLTNAAAAMLDMAASNERTPVITAQCRAAFEALVAKMQFIKDRHFKIPPLLESDFVSLLLKIRDSVPSSRGAPRAQMTAEIGRSGTAMLLLKLIYAEGTENLADAHTDIEFQIRHARYNPANPVNNPAAGEIDHIPADPLELSVVFTTKRKREMITFGAGDPGKTAYFAIRISNGRGGENEGYGPFCPIFHAVIP